MREHILPAPLTVLTTPFVLGPLKSPSVQAKESSLTSSRKVDLEPPAAPRKYYGAAATTRLGECVPTSGPQAGTPEGQVASEPLAIWEV